MVKENIAVIIAVRTQSSRLPNKCLIDLNGKSVLNRITDRCAESGYCPKIIIATTTLPEDDCVAREAESLTSCFDMDVFRGDPINVYNRVRDAAKYHNIQIIVRVTADCPLVDPTIIDATILPVLLKRADYAASRLNPDAYSDGLDVEVFRTELMTPENTPDRLEDITQGIKKNCKRQYALPMTSYGPLGNRRWTLDTPEDLEFIRKVYSHFGDSLFTWEDVLKWEDSCR